MTLNRRAALIVCGGLLIGLLLPAVAAVAGDSPPWSDSPPSSDSPPTEGRMTGGGRGEGPLGVTHGFQLRCDLQRGPNSLQIQWGRGKNRHSFHLVELTDAVCSDDPSIDPGKPSAAFDTFEGTGTGRLDKTTADIWFRFTDVGEPGTGDTLRLLITDADGGVVLDADIVLRSGNHQAHSR